MEPREVSQMFSLEEDYWWYRSLRRRILAALVRSGPLDFESTGDRETAGVAPPICLDAGCGSGMLLSMLGERVVGLGLDNSRLALSLASRRGLRQLLCASVDALPLRDASLDILVSADVLYHRDVHDDVGALRDMARCLKPGALLVLNLPAFSALRSAHDDAVHCARRYTRHEVHDMLVQAGLAPLSVRYWNWILFLPIALVRLLRRRPRPSWEIQPDSTSGPSRESRSDLVALPAWLNASLDLLMRMEERLAFFRAPAGISVLAVAKRV